MSATVSSPLSAYRGQLDSSGEDRILVLDFGSQTAQLIARRVREQNVLCQLVRHDLPIERIRELNPRGLILSGGPASVYEPGAPTVDPRIFDLGIPILGICYGMHLICQSHGCQVRPGATREFGLAISRNDSSVDLFAGVPEQTRVWMSHGDQVDNLTASFISLAETNTCTAAAVKHRTKMVYGVQYHPEVTHSEAGPTILKNFVRNICGCSGTWRIEQIIEREIALIRQRVGDRRVICALSGGVDSSVVAALLVRAIGPQLTCIFVDNGLLRKGEVEQVRAQFADHFGIDLRVVDASERFLTALSGITEPQQKRQQIGRLFIDVFKEEARQISDVQFLAQGTLYPDVIESGANPDGPAAVIKAHHNVGGLPAELGFNLIEPLRDLFKDEVRQMGRVLGLPEALVSRHPFPGPGLAVRCLGEVSADRLKILRDVDHIFLEELHKAGLYGSTSQAFAVLLPVQTVGVMGDARTYESAVALRAVITDDFMTADWATIPDQTLRAISSRITNSVRGVNRVVYDISSKPPATIEWE